MERLRCSQEYSDNIFFSHFNVIILPFQRKDFYLSAMNKCF